MIFLLLEGRNESHPEIIGSRRLGQQLWHDAIEKKRKLIHRSVLVVGDIPVGEKLKALRTDERHKDRYIIIRRIFERFQRARRLIMEPRADGFPILIWDEFGEAIDEIKTSPQTLAVFEYRFKSKSMLAMTNPIRD